MKYIVLILSLSFCAVSFAQQNEIKCGKYENRQLYKGEKGIAVKQN